MALLDWYFFSKVLDKNYAFRVLLPDEVDKPLHVLYLLHGLSDDFTGWSRLTSLERYWGKFADRLAIVMPDAGRSFYTDPTDEHGGKYESFFLKEFIPYFESHLTQKIPRERRAICGLSMGGYGAFRLALKSDNIFGTVGSFSGALDFLRYSKSQEFSCRMWDESNNISVLINNWTPQIQPRIKMLCGDQDFLLESNRAFSALLKEKGFVHEYKETPGIHNWTYWDTNLPEMLDFIMSSPEK